MCFIPNSLSVLCAHCGACWRSGSARRLAKGARLSGLVFSPLARSIRHRCFVSCCSIEFVGFLCFEAVPVHDGGGLSSHALSQNSGLPSTKGLSPASASGSSDREKSLSAPGGREAPPTGGLPVSRMAPLSLPCSRSVQSVSFIPDVGSV